MSRAVAVIQTPPVRILVGLSMPLLVACACATGQPPGTPGTDEPGERGSAQSRVDSLQTRTSCSGVILETVELINDERRQRGLSALACSSTVAEAAAIHAEDLCRNNRFSHTGTDGSSMVDRARRVDLEFRALGENIAKGQRSADEVVSEWMKSPGHRRNILNEAFDRVGTARTQCPQSAPIWVQVFTGG